MAHTASNGYKKGENWWNDLNRYHWFVLIVAALGWLFDCLDQQLFTLARVPAMTELLAKPGIPPSKEMVAEYGGYATSIFLIGWASGGLFFGVLGDRVGRARTMIYTILLYSVCTGLSALSVSFWDFAFYRFITGLGVGGEFAVGVALVAEVMPERARPYAIGLLQALSTVGNVSAAGIGLIFGQLQSLGHIESSWRYMFLIGAMPALLALVIRRRLKEPEKWQAAKSGSADIKKLGSYKELFGNRLWRRRAFVGLTLAFSGVVGLWGIGFFIPDLIRAVLLESFQNQGLSAAAVQGELGKWSSIGLLLSNVGAFFGIYGFGTVSQKIGRRPTFAIGFIAAGLSTAFVFWNLRTINDFWMLPIMGFCQLSLFGGYAIYFPELFPTHLRSTGTSFCYNVGRFVAAVGPAALGLLTSTIYASKDQPMRYAGITMCAVFLVGLCALPFAPETKGQALPESDRGFTH
ncbi:MAG: MFS transporter [Verrucomicrobiales bacterium]